MDLVWGFKFASDTVVDLDAYDPVRARICRLLSSTVDI
jgi:hypothetical protein